MPDTVAFIGLGAMGAPMASNLLFEGQAEFVAGGHPRGAAELAAAIAQISALRKFRQRK